MLQFDGTHLISYYRFVVTVSGTKIGIGMASFSPSISPPLPSIRPNLPHAHQFIFSEGD